MYLENISIENFKSFARKMEIPVREGYTNITGPNGSGKSNIGDAILFVLGPKSSKEIRAGRLTDLIFNGGKKGKPADKCRVSLTFNNEDKAIPLNEPKVTFTRKVQRSDNAAGYNSYFYINGRSSSLTEFQELLSYAGITPDGYNMVQQGDISRIVDMSDLDRRRVLDQISGITQYDNEIDKAQKSKEEVVEDLERIKILLDEIGNQVKELEADTRDALKHQEVSDKLAEAKSMKVWKTRKTIETDIRSLKKDIEENLDKCSQMESDKDELAKRKAELEKEKRDVESELADRGSEKNKELQKRVNDLNLEIARASDKVEDYHYEIKEKKELLKKYNEALTRETESLADITGKLTDSKGQRDDLEKKLVEVDEEIERIRVEQASSHKDIKELQKNALELSKRLDSKNDQLSKAKVERDRVSDRIDRANETLAEHEEDLETLRLNKKDAEWVLKENMNNSKGRDKELKTLQEEFHRYRNDEKRLRDDKSDLEDRLTRLEREYSKLNAQDEAARTVKRGYNRAVETILQARDTGKIRGVHGTVAELAGVSKEYETALQVAAGGRMQSIVVDSDAVASDAIKILKKKRAGRATFLPINKMLPGRPSGKAIRTKQDEKSLGFALDLVDYEEKYENVFWYVFQDTVVMKDIDSARRLMGGVRMVTMDGESIERSGAMVGGTLGKNTLSFQAPDRGKLERVGMELKQTRDNLDKVIKELRSAEKALQETQEKLMDVQSKGDKSEKIKTLNTDIKRFKEKITKRESKKTDTEKEIEEARNTLASLDKEVASLQGYIESLKKERDEISVRIRKISPKELSSRLEELRNSRVELKSTLSELVSEIKLCASDKERSETDIEEIRTMISTINEDIPRLESSIKKKDKTIKKFTEEKQALEKDLSSMDKELMELRDKRDALFQKVLEQDKKMDGKDSKIEALKLYINGLESKIGTHRGSLEELKEGSKEDVDYSDSKLPSMKELKSIIHRCEQKLEGMGPVNMRAVKDYEVKKERKEKLQEEFTQLNERREGLDELISELDEKKKVGLIKVKNEINENFMDVYKELSDGGEAHLELEDPESPFDGGLIIKARPPGKKVHRIHALSGGEKGVVSMAFIFALQKYDPSPFYLLDEIDQNLDGVNAKKVAEMIKGNSRSAQFLQVSLRKTTLQSSDHIIGVTINNKGVSDVIMKVDMGMERESDIPELSELSQLEEV